MYNITQLAIQLLIALALIVVGGFTHDNAQLPANKKIGLVLMVIGIGLFVWTFVGPQLKS